MIDSRDDEYEAQFATFLASLDSDIPTDVLVVDAKLVNEVAYNDDPEESNEFLTPDSDDSHSWQELAANTVDLESLKKTYMNLPESGNDQQDTRFKGSKRLRFVVTSTLLRNPPPSS